MGDSGPSKTPSHPSGDGNSTPTETWIRSGLEVGNGCTRSAATGEMYAANDDWIQNAVRFDNLQFSALTTDVEPKFINTARWRKKGSRRAPTAPVLLCFWHENEES